MELKAPGTFRIVPAMNRWLLLASLLLLPALAAAQPFQFGINLGVADPQEDGFDFDMNDSFREVYFGARIDENSYFNVKLGQIATDVSPIDETQDGDLDYVQGLVEYQFDEIWGSSALFLGPGLYRAKLGEEDDTQVGVAGGVNTTFPLTRRMGLQLELAYHWVNFEEETQFITAGVGLKFAF